MKSQRKTPLESPIAQKGMTLFELLIVLAIVALMAGLVAPRVIGYLGKARSDVAVSQMASLVTALELYALDIGSYPSEDEGLDALIEGGPNTADWSGPYLRDKEGLVDPWGNRYLYSVNTDRDLFEILTLGRDGSEGGDGEDADLSKR